MAPSLSTSVICQSSVQNAVVLNSSSVLTLCSLLSNFTTRHFSFLSTSSTKCLTLCTDELAREGSVHQFVGPEPALWFLRKNIKTIIKCCLVNQQMILWQGLTSTQRKARESISDPTPITNTNLLFFHRTQYRVVNGLLAGPKKTLRRHPYITGLVDSPVCTRCEAEEEISAHVLCECEALTTLRHTYPRTWTSVQGKQRTCRKPTCIAAERARTHHLL